MGEKVTAKCNPKVCNFHGGGAREGRGGAGDAELRAPPSPPLQGERARGGAVGSGWKLTRGRAASRWRCPRCLGSHLPPYLSPPAPPTPKNPSPTAIRAERRPTPSPEISRSLLPLLLLPPARAPPNLSASGGAGAAAKAVTRGLGLAQPCCSHTPPSPPPPAHPHLSPSSSPPPSPPPPPPSSPAHVGRSSITSCNQCR